MQLEPLINWLPTVIIGPVVIYLIFKRRKKLSSLTETLDPSPNPVRFRTAGNESAIGIGIELNLFLPSQLPRCEIYIEDKNMSPLIKLESGLLRYAKLPKGEKHRIDFNLGPDKCLVAKVKDGFPLEKLKDRRLHEILECLFRSAAKYHLLNPTLSIGTEPVFWSRQPSISFGVLSMQMPEDAPQQLSNCCAALHKLANLFL